MNSGFAGHVDVVVGGGAFGVGDASESHCPPTDIDVRVMKANWQPTDGPSRTGVVIYEATAGPGVGFF